MTSSDSLSTSQNYRLPVNGASLSIAIILHCYFWIEISGDTLVTVFTVYTWPAQTPAHVTRPGITPSLPSSRLTTLTPEALWWCDYESPARYRSQYPSIHSAIQGELKGGSNHFLHMQYFHCLLLLIEFCTHACSVFWSGQLKSEALIVR